MTENDRPTMTVPKPVTGTVGLRRGGRLGVTITTGERVEGLGDHALVAILSALAAVATQTLIAGWYGWVLTFAFGFFAGYAFCNAAYLHASVESEGSA